MLRSRSLSQSELAEAPDARRQRVGLAPSLAAVLGVYRIIGMDQVVDPLCCSSLRW